MLFLVIVSILLTRNLKVDHISRRQAILELVVTTIDNFFKMCIRDRLLLLCFYTGEASRLW